MKRLIWIMFVWLLWAIPGALWGVPTVAVAQDVPPDSPPYADYADEFRFTLLELGYGETQLDSPYDSVTYDLRIPSYWQVREGSFLDVDFSYQYLGLEEGAAEVPPYLGELVVAVDGQVQGRFQLRAARLAHTHFRVDLSPDLFRVVGRIHSIEITLDADYICRVPHEAWVTIHPTTFFSLVYDLTPLVADLADYPRPFYQRAFEPDRVLFVLPDTPTQEELTAATAVAAKLGDLASEMIISGTTATAFLESLAVGDTTGGWDEHLIVVGKPEDNELILALNEMERLPVSVAERQLRLSTAGPRSVAPGDVLTYHLTLANPDQGDVSSLTFVDVLPADTYLVSCAPMCDISELELELGDEHRVVWSVDTLASGESQNYTLVLAMEEDITSSITEPMVIENTSVLLGAASEPLNVSTLTTTLLSLDRSGTVSPPQAGRWESNSSKSDYFFQHAGWPVPENDGIVQEVISPWNPRRAILVITGLWDESVHKAGQAMGSENDFPGMAGPVALVQAVRPSSAFSSRSLTSTSDMTFADLGYDDRVLEGVSQEINYYVDLPASWLLTPEAYLQLYFSHSQLIDYARSFLSVLYNGQPVAMVSLDEETALEGALRVRLPASQARPGERNKISIQAMLRPIDECMHIKAWLRIGNDSFLHLDHTERETQYVDLRFYPHPFDHRVDLGDVLFVLPPQPRPEEWEQMLRVAADLGRVSGGDRMQAMVMTTVGEGVDIDMLSDYHLIVIGRPSRNPLLRQVNAQLPQPFLPDSDGIEQRLNDVILRLPLDVSLGYLELIPSPWNPERVLLAVTGTSDEGVAWATESLLDQPWQLEGDLALVRGTEIHTLDTSKLTRSGVGTVIRTVVPELTPVVSPSVSSSVPTSTALFSSTMTPRLTTPQPGDRGTSSTSSPPWLAPLVAGTALVVIVILAFGVWQARRNRNTL